MSRTEPTEGKARNTSRPPSAPDWDKVLEPHLPPELRARLAETRVGLAGAGGLGSNCAALLVRSGIRRLYVADPDVVTLSNLNRQFFLPRHVGQLKVAALGAMLRAINPDVELDLRPIRLDPAAALSFFRPCPLVVEAVDAAETKRSLVESLLEAGHVVVSASGMAGWGGDMRRRILGRLTVVGDFTSAVGPDGPAMGPRVQMAAAMQADEVLRRILDAEPDRLTPSLPTFARPRDGL